MAKGIVVLGQDPGFLHFGYALAEVSRRKVVVLDMGLIVTKSSSKKARVLRSDDNARRSKELVRGLAPLYVRAHVAVNEAMSFVRSASTMAQIGRAFGIKDTFVEVRRLPNCEVSPMQIKMAVCGNRSASKDEIQAALDDRFGYSLSDRHCPHIPAGKLEHPYDALGAIIACLDSDVVRAATAGLSA